MHALDLKIPPVVVVLTAAALMAAAAWAAPSLALTLPARGALAAALALAGLAVAAAGVVAFRRGRTTVNPLAPQSASALVRSGPYRFTRNPMYLGMLLALAGWGAWLAHPVSLAVLAAFVAYLDRFQIAPEERALAARFGAEFAAYRARVRRWL